MPGASADYIETIRAVIGHLEAVAKGDRDAAILWLSGVQVQSPMAIASDFNLRLLARDLGLIAGPHLLEQVPGEGLYRPPFNCQIPYCAAIYEELFGLRRDGFFVEAGAYDGESFSNTSFLADIGWRGIYVEPVNEFYRICQYRHAPNLGVRVVNLALSDQVGEIELKLAAFSSSAHSGLQGAIADLPGFSDWVSPEPQICRTEPLGDILGRLGAPQAFDLLVLDVEGYEELALRGIDLSVWQPKVVLIETADRHPDFSKVPTLVANTATCRAILEERYDEFLSDDSNSIYVRR
jgi:FkbM family methyltransferase